jgi:hypothetical protein
MSVKVHKNGLMASATTKPAAVRTATARVNLSIAAVRQNLTGFLRAEGAALEDPVQFVAAKRVSANVYEYRERAYGFGNRTEITLSSISESVTQIDMETYPDKPGAPPVDEVRVEQSQSDVNAWAERFEAYVSGLDQRSVG